ncbi:hypothetical protein HFV04_021680 [Pseudomonas sp. BIGb0427]|uniref:hypothetical protein n=1 Tax=unclassified Pseudomonas TaxID=196821 RepID=UPI0016B9CD45|nr:MULTISPECIES: hypothetical protein [unclassified Pseudomonas]NLU60458.1 hypothetical protein [Pseudomonas sp. BIGb0427]QPG62113.1 hypothetical protein HFV04_021680 [Pseudomonas sp. BIGb0427]UVL53995.1 hypothetical protein LOY22_13975 [Pseudomonas sp. B21-035]
MNDEQRHQEWIAQRKAEEAKRRERAAECLKDHQYTVLADTDQLKAWRCKAPGTTCYAFDILITRFGIATVGDIDGLTFNVGLSYGIEFLAGDDIGYYIHSKLEGHCREREFDEDAFRAALVTGVCNQVCEHIDEDQYSDLPEWMRNDGGRHEAGRWDELRKLVTEHLAAIEYGEDGRDFWDSLNDRLSEADDISYVEQASMFMSEHHEELGLGCDYWEITIDKPRDSLINRLYLINHAAKAIVAQQAEAKAA